MPKLRKLLPRNKRLPLSRSEMMSRIRSRNTLPERRMRALLSRLEISYRMHVVDLPGKPDFVNKKRKWAIFVHGCFWHSHGDCKLASRPKSNQNYWGPKLRRNRERDASKIEDLKSLGYRVLIVWECETRKNGKVESRVREFFAK